MKKLLLSLGAVAAVVAPVAAVVACGADKTPTKAGTNNNTGTQAGPATVNGNAGDQTPATIDASIITDTAIDTSIDQIVITEKATTPGVTTLDINSALTTDELKNVFGTDIDKGIAADEAALGIKIPASFDRSTIEEGTEKVTSVSWNQDSFRLIVIQGEDDATGMPDMSLPYLKTIFNIIPAKAVAAVTTTVDAKPAVTTTVDAKPAVAAPVVAKPVVQSLEVTEAIKTAISENAGVVPASDWVPTTADEISLESMINDVKEYIATNGMSAGWTSISNAMENIDPIFGAFSTDEVNQFMVNAYFNKVLNSGDLNAIRAIGDSATDLFALDNAIEQYLMNNPDAL